MDENYQGIPWTQYEAWLSMQPVIPKIKIRVLKYVEVCGKRGATRYECATAFGDTYNTIAPRFTELHNEGKLEIFTARENATARMAMVYRIPEKK